MTKAVEQAARPSNEPEQIASKESEQIASLEAEQVAQDASLLGGYAYQIIRQQSKKVFKLRSQVLADTDIEHLHDMRIGTRKLRAALLLFSDVIGTAGPDNSLDNSAITATAQPVKQLTKTLGKVRDIDVMQDWFSQAVDSSSKKDASFNFSKKEKKTINTLLKKLKKRRKKQFAKMADTLQSSDYKKLTKRFKQWLKQPTFSPAAKAPANSNAISRVIPPLTALLQHPGWQIATQKRGQQLTPKKAITLPQLNQQLETESDKLHDLRKQIKQTRYQTEFFRSLYGITYAAQIRELRTLQKVLGELQDQLVISEFLSTELGENWPEKLPSLHQSFQDSRLALWKKWQPLQAKYLKLGEQLGNKVAA